MGYPKRVFVVQHNEHPRKVYPPRVFFSKICPRVADYTPTRNPSKWGLALWGA